MLTLENLTLRYQKQTVLDIVSFTFTDGCATAIVGASGIGKSTLLHAVAGLKRCDGGKILSSHERVSYIFQEPRLFPWMTALENITTVGATKDAAMQLLSLLFEDADEVANKYPQELSGGMKQRISVARALAYKPDLLLLDEPFRGLDAETKASVTRMIFEQMQGKTMLLVTHDDADLSLCDEVVRLTGAPVSSLLLEKSGSRKHE